MKIDSQNKAEKFWDRTASNYDKEEEKDEKTYVQIVEKTISYVKSSDIVLDLGCGTGLVSNEIAEYVQKIDAIDLSSKMIEIAKTKAKKREIQNIEYAQATVFDDRLKSASYDVVLCFYVLHLLEEPHEVLRKIQELLKPDGILISVTPCMGEKPVQGVLFSLLNRIGIIPGIRLFKRRELEGLFAKGNFNTIENERLAQTSNQYFMVSKN